jgi:hypothetical protein
MADCCITASDCQAIVVFMGDVSVGWAKLLKPGFRHCFTVVGRRDQWIVFDPMCNFTNLGIVSGPTIDHVAEWYRQYGFTVVKTAVRRDEPRAMEWRLFTCVEAVKRVLGIHAPWVVTPWQLYHHIARCEETKTLTSAQKKE